MKINSLVNKVFYIWIKLFFMKLFDLSHFKENCPIEARNYFKEIILKLEKIEKRLDSIESGFNK